MGKHITYLFGAGASKNALPIVKEMPERIRDFLTVLNSPEFKYLPTDQYRSEHVKRTKKEISEQFVNDLIWLRSECEDHASVDTFAKKLFLKKDTYQLLRLKAVLSAYLTFEQALHSKEDKRYDGFFASILNKDVHNLPSQIKIISWNYDFQFEKAYSGYINETRIVEVQRALNVHTNFLKNKDQNKFGIYKVNGTTGLFQTLHQSEYHINPHIPERFDKSLMDDVLQHYYYLLEYPDIMTSSLSFAWEEFNNKHDIVSTTTQAVKNTEVLIVIGYSFPFFNREIDRKIIGSMKDLKKVYFQAPDAENIRERFLSIREDIAHNMLVPHSNIDQFLLPKEL